MTDVQSQQTSKKFSSLGVDVLLASNIHQLTEAVLWWRNNEGGLTTNKNLPEGLLVGRSVAPGEVLNERTIITWAADKLGDKDRRYESRSKQVKIAIEKRLQLGVVISAQHPGLKEYKIELPKGEAYGLAGYWTMTDCWEVERELKEGEKEALNKKARKAAKDKVDDENTPAAQPESKKALMVRLDKVTPGQCWWYRTQNSTIPTPASKASCPEGTCDNCKVTSVLRFPGQFSCCHPGCTSSRKLLALDEKAVYRAEYIDWRPLMDNLSSPSYEYRPLEIQDAADKATLEALVQSSRKPMWAGYLCQHCWRINQTIYPWVLTCRNCGHKFSRTIPAVTLEDMVESKYLTLDDNSKIDGIVTAEGVTELPRIPHPDYIIMRWNLDGESSVVWLMLPKSHMITGHSGTRDRFNKLLEVTTGSQGVRYRRFQMKQSKVKEQVTRWFGLNIGVPYASNMLMDETNAAFDANLPEVLHDIKNHISFIVQASTGNQPNFNEMLSMLYFPGMEMGWHNDGEDDVVRGEAVASESLGGSAEMKFRLNQTLYAGKTGSGVIAFDKPVLPGCLKYTERKQLKDEYESGQITREDYQARLKQVLSSTKWTKSPPVLLKFPLPGTGAIMMQRGPHLNERYQHTVVPSGLLRFVNTARCLKEPTEVKDTKDKKAAKLGDKRKRVDEDDEQDEEEDGYASAAAFGTQDDDEDM